MEYYIYRNNTWLDPAGEWKGEFGVWWHSIDEEDVEEVLFSFVVKRAQVQVNTYDSNENTTYDFSSLLLYWSKWHSVCRTTPLYYY